MYSQANEDDVIVRVFENSPPGRFLDVGAWDPVDLSNSRRLWELGWSGVMIEPSPSPMLKLLDAYGNDSKISLVNAAVGLAPDLISFHIADYAVSTSEPKNWEEWKNREAFRGSMFVPVITLEHIKFQFGDFDFINFDAEGTSVALFFRMLGLGWSPACVCVEHDGRVHEIQDAIKNLYAVIEQNSINVILAKRNR